MSSIFSQVYGYRIVSIFFSLFFILLFTCVSSGFWFHPLAFGENRLRSFSQFSVITVVSWRRLLRNLAKGRGSGMFRVTQGSLVHLESWEDLCRCRISSLIEWWRLEIHISSRKFARARKLKWKFQIHEILIRKNGEVTAESLWSTPETPKSQGIISCPFLMCSDIWFCSATGTLANYLQC